MYSLVRKLLFRLDPEDVHYKVLKWLNTAYNTGLGKQYLIRNYCYNHTSVCKEVFGLKFKNPVGLAAGFDKDAKFIEELSCLGFGHIEIGTLTPKGQDGNEKPRLFRLPNDGAIINRMGFNNEGVDVAVERLKLIEKGNIIIGGNIGKNKNTPNDKAVDDYIYCFNALFNYVDYFVVNVSSPNTPNLRELQEKEPLHHLLLTLQNLNLMRAHPKPILLKIAPDLTWQQIDDVIDIIQDVKLAGIVATNTTISRDGLLSNKLQVEDMGIGGLSGKPLRKRATEVIRYIANKTNNTLPIIAVGGIFNGKDAQEKLAAGASLVQVYTGFIYTGPGIVKNILKTISNNKKTI
jgi:dihydroorotate dehydrogenase